MDVSMAMCQRLFHSNSLSIQPFAGMPWILFPEIMLHTHFTAVMQL
jgi:hypothetical protein